MFFYQTVLNRYLIKFSGLWRSIWRHVAGFVLTAIVLSFLAEPFLVRLDAGLPKHVPGLVEKRKMWSQNKERFDLVFIGDSRTYLGIAPTYIEQSSGLKGYNLGFWANWLPTQVALIRDISKDLPKRKIIVWSVSHDTFKKRPGEVNTIYPLGMSNAFSLWQNGFSIRDLSENVLRFFPGLSLFVARDRLRMEMNTLLASNGSAAPSVDDTLFKQVAEAGKSTLNAFAALPVISQNAVTAVDFYTDDGGLVRQELVSEYYRARQLEASRDLAPADHFQPDSVYVELFQSTLRWLKEHRIPVIVNEMELAPYHYGHGRSGESFRNFMTSLRADLEREAVPYIRVAFETYPNKYYFDFTHLNHDGVRAYAKDFVTAAVPYVNVVKDEVNGAVQ